VTTITSLRQQHYEPRSLPPGGRHSTLATAALPEREQKSRDQWWLLVLEGQPRPTDRCAQALALRVYFYRRR